MTTTIDVAKTNLSVVSAPAAISAPKVLLEVVSAPAAISAPKIMMYVITKPSGARIQRRVSVRGVKI